MCISAILGVGSALIGASSASSAADAQTAAAKNDIAFQKETRDKIIERVDPFYKSGLTAQDAYLYNLGLGNAPTIGGNALAVNEFTETTPGVGTPRPVQQANQGSDYREILDRWNATGGYSPETTKTRYRVGDQVFDDRTAAEEYAAANPTGGTQYQGFQASPGYQFAFDQGTAGVNALAGARGGLNSGRTLEALNTFGQGIANQEWGNYMNRLAGLTDQGMGAASLQAQASSNAASGVSNAYSNIGNAQAAGAIGVGNALQTGIGNIAGLYNYQKNLAASQPLFGGNSWG